MPQQSTQCRQTLAQSGDPVGRCCQRHTITGQVMTAWYPTKSYVEPVNNCCCQGTQFSFLYRTATRRTRRGTVSCASDNCPGQSEKLCSGTTGVVSQYNYTFRTTFRINSTVRYHEKWVPGPWERDREIWGLVDRFDIRGRNLTNRFVVGSRKACLSRPTPVGPRRGASA